MKSEDKLVAIVVSAIFLTFTACLYIAASVFPRVNAEAKALVLQEANKTLEILVSPEISLEKKKECEGVLRAALGLKRREGDER